MLKKLLAVILLVVTIAAAWLYRSVQPVGVGERQTVTIARGASVQGIGVMLEERGMIRSAGAFRFVVWWQGKTQALQAGRFVLAPTMTVSEIIATLTGGKPVELVITIPEGTSVAELDRLLARKGLSQTGAVLQCVRTCDFSSFTFLPKNLTGIAVADAPGGRVEGYLFPDTYYVLADGFTAETFLRRLLQTFSDRVLRGLALDLRQSGRSLHEVVTLASILENEARGDTELQTVAGILWKRNDESRGLDVDATIRYIVAKRTAPLTVTDLTIDSPYNTRKYRGLPPGPIGNPGLRAIRAALHPISSPYYYYLHDPQGQIHYAVTNDEHNVNKEKYLRN